MGATRDALRRKNDSDSYVFVARSQEELTVRALAQSVIGDDGVDFTTEPHDRRHVESHVRCPS
jgi:hypothetical protein